MMKIRKRAAIGHLTLIACLALIQASAYAGSTGKIAGVITDSARLTGLPGANVMLEGTTIGTVCDLRGNYSILNIPPGVYKLKASMIGYRAVLVRDIRVSVDLTTSIDVSLEATTLESAEAVTVTAARPLVQRDMTSSLSTVNSEEIADLPVQSMNDVLELQAGVVRDGNNFHIRGGRAGEVSYWVDGIAANEVFGGGSALTVEKSAVQELQVVSGTFNAEYGNAMSGIVNIITKEGGNKLNGQVTLYAGDYVSGNDVYSVLRKVTPVVSPVTGVTRAVEDLENPLKKFNPVTNGEFNLSGPVPFAGNRLSFMVNGRYFSQDGYVYGRRWFYPQGIPGDNALVPLSPSTSVSGMGKLTFRLSNSLKFNYSLFLNRWQTDHFLNLANKYNPDGSSGGKTRGLTHLFGLNHTLSAKTFYEAKVSHVYNRYQSYLYENPEEKPDYFIWVRPDTSSGGYWIYEDPNSDAGKRALEDLKAAGRLYSLVADPAHREGYVHPDSLLLPTAYSFRRAGTDMNHYTRTTSYWIGKFDLTSQVNPVHQVKAGLEWRMHELSLDDITLQAKRKEGKDEQIVPFEPWVPPVESIFHNKYTRKPTEFSAYLQDKIELKDMIMNIGVRFDYFNSNGVLPADPKDPSVYNPFRDSNIYRNPSDPDSLRTPYTPDERRAFMQKNATAKTQVSPRIGIAYPITDRGIIHFSYGHFFKMPEFQYLYDNPDFKLLTGGGWTVIGNAALNAERTVQYEIGLQQQLSDQVGVDVSLFYKDIRDWVGTSPLVTTLKPSVAYSVYENKDYANVYGVVLDLEKRYSSHFSGNLSYSFQVAEGTYSNPLDAFNAISARTEPRLNLIPMNWDQRHTLMATATLGAAGWTLTFQGKYQTGRPYTPTYARGSFVGGAAQVGYRDNSARLPSTSQLDLLLHRRFRVGPLNLGFLVTVYNVFDQKGETAVYTETGTARYSVNLDPGYVNYNTLRIGTVEDLVRRPDWYIAPRQVQAGLTLEF
jgi:outer membrane receptor for ferrienterochelin and colicin